MDNHRLHVKKDGTVHYHTADGGQTPVNRICEALSNERCRYILYALEKDEPIGLDKLVDEVPQEELNQSPTDTADAVQQSLRIQLHHRHLPKLRHLGIIEYDPRSEIVRYRESPPHLDEFLQLTQKLDTE